MKKLTTTSHAMLGLLALKPWTTYELAQQMERSLSNFWPRAQSKLYEEPKNLVAHGLATAKRERVGRRPRTVYTITPKGREALRAWLDEPAAPMSLEFEGILKVFLADQDTREQLLDQIRHIKAHAEQEKTRGMAFIQEYAETGGPFPERLHIIGLVVGFLSGLNGAVLDWADWAESEVSQWDEMDKVPSREMFQRFMERGRFDVARD